MSISPKALIVYFIFILFFLTSAGILFGGNANQDNIIIVLDDSGSMAQHLIDKNRQKVKKMKAAKVALREVLKTIPDTTHIGLISFSYNWLYPLGPKNDQALNDAINKLQPRGGTPLGAYLKKAADSLLAQREKQYGYGTYRLLIVTDGEASDRRLVELYTPEILSRGIILNVIGVNMKKDHSLKKMAHTYRSAKDPTTLKQAIEEVFAEVSATASDGAQEGMFEVLEPLPDGFAMKAIEALSVMENSPIGKKPSRGQMGVPIKNTVRKPNAMQKPIPPNPVKKARKKSKFTSLFIFVIIIFVLVSISKKKRKTY